MISVIIPNINSAVIDRVIAALLQQSASHLLAEIIVVGQDQQQRVPSHPQVRFINTAQILKIGPARNLGARFASGDHLLFLDSDCIPSAGLLEHFHARHAAGFRVVGGSIMPVFRSYWNLCDHTIIYASYLENAVSGTRPYLPGGFLTIERTLFLDIGAFDEDPQQIAGEDLDLSFRLRRCGIPLFFEPKAVVYHHHPRPALRQGLQHLYGFGRTHATLWARHGFPLPLRMGTNHRLWAALIIGAAPLLALWDVIQMYSREPALRTKVTLVPGLIWLKIAWYWGAASGLLQQQAVRSR